MEEIDRPVVLVVGCTNQKLSGLRIRIPVRSFISNTLINSPVISLGELAIRNGSDKVSTYSMRSSSLLEETRRKRTFEFPDLLKRVDSAKVIYPRGVLSRIKEGMDDIPPVKRIEFFAKDGNDTYGILRSIFIAFSSEKSILNIADASGGVVQVRSIRSRNSKRIDGSSDSAQDKLILKRSDEIDQGSRPVLSIKTPTITVSPRWRERMKLETGDCLIVSNPIEEYAVPPPNI